MSNLSIPNTTIYDCFTVYKYYIKKAWCEAWNIYFSSTKKAIFSTILTCAVGSTVYIAIFSWKSMLEQILTYTAFTVAPLSILFILSFIYQLIKKPVNIYHAYIFSRITQDFFNQINQYSIEGKVIYNILKKEIPTDQSIDKLSAWRLNISTYLREHNYIYYSNLFDDLDTLDEIQIFCTIDKLTTQREIPVFGKDREQKEKILDNEHINELRRCLAILGYIKMEIHPATFPNVGRIKP